MDPNIEIIRYTPDYKDIWNKFVESSKNGTFLFNRGYMDYHADRFHDFSVLIYRKGKLYCLLPANIQTSSLRDGEKEKVLYSHQGLTYGGLVMSDKCTAEGILQVFDSLLEYLRKEGIKKFIYKPIPYIYQSLPSEEDLYALFRHDAKLIVRNISSTIPLPYQLPLHKDRREAVRRAQKNGLYVRPSKDFDAFWKILEDNLMATYKARPVHSLEEMKRLVEIFPENIKLWGSYDENNRMLGGLVGYYTKDCVHAQYISATPEGKKLGAVDLLINRLMVAPNILPHEANHYKDLNISEEEIDYDYEPHWLDLGTSNEDGGRILNESLIYQKEGFGGRAVCYDTYEIQLK